MLNKKIIKGEHATLFCMPSLEDERAYLDEQTIREKAEEIQRQAYEEGFNSGEKAGYEKGEQKAEILISSLHQIIEEISGVKNDLIDNLESQTVDLSLTIARKIIKEEVKSRPEVIVTMVKAALQRLQRSGTISVKINPVLHDMFMEKKPELMEVHSDITFDVNSHISVSGPLVVSEIEEVVTDIDSLLDNIIEELNTGKAGSKNTISIKEKSDEHIPEEREQADAAGTDATAVQREVEESSE